MAAEIGRDVTALASRFGRILEALPPSLDPFRNPPSTDSKKKRTLKHLNETFNYDANAKLNMNDIEVIL
ncbi:unnamed protein product [Leptosia nina]|uniref:Uncharacterized protein n=1 Tax=Leptosia nina TaxID=320188 RepID=A0AAV1JQ01_9NEOP